VSTPRYEEVAQHKAELDEVKKENEALKQRIRDLERQIRGNNDADGQRGRRGAPQSQSSGVGNASDDAQAPANARAVPEESSR
jgi:predicted  nucleic acid-binding Zn-ribbon protein